MKMGEGPWKGALRPLKYHYRLVTLDRFLLVADGLGHFIQLAVQNFLTVLSKFLSLIKHARGYLASLGLDLGDSVLYAFSCPITQLHRLILDGAACFFTGLGCKKQRRAGTDQAANQ